MDYVYTDSSPPDLHAVELVLYQALAAVRKSYPELPAITRTEDFTRHWTETLLLACVDALSRLVKKEETDKVDENSIDSLLAEVFPKRPQSLQAPNSRPAIAAEIASAERQKS